MKFRLHEKLSDTFSAKEQAEYETFQEFIVDNYYDQMEKVDYSFVTELYSWEDKFSDPSKYLHALDEEGNLHLTQSDFMTNDMSEDQLKSAVKSWFLYNHELTELIIPIYPKIPSEFCKDAYQLKSVKFLYPDSVTSIGDEAFSGCSELEKIDIPNSVTTIGFSAFHGCRGLSSITIPDSVISIEEDTFCKCSQLSSVTIPNSVTSVGWSAFWDCFNLQEINIPDSVKSIENSAFWGCFNLQRINIPDSVTYIGDTVFEDCDNLTVHTKNPIAIDYCKKNRINYIEEE